MQASDLCPLPRLVRVTYELQTGQRHSWQIWNWIPRQAARKASASRDAGLFHARVWVCQALPSLSVRCGLTPVARRVPTRRTQQGGLPAGLLLANLVSGLRSWASSIQNFCKHDSHAAQLSSHGARSGPVVPTAQRQGAVMRSNSVRDTPSAKAPKMPWHTADGGCEAGRQARPGGGRGAHPPHPHHPHQPQHRRPGEGCARFRAPLRRQIRASNGSCTTRACGHMRGQLRCRLRWN